MNGDKCESLLVYLMFYLRHLVSQVVNNELSYRKMLTINKLIFKDIIK